ncbi:MAG: hypothetical protein P1Q69_21180 [Candidatus Thorarchaeota archaeon]|nr:hypothetical protein [Candidatus Thorarchaeota archaeon]
MLATSDTVDNSSSQKTDEIEPDLFITVYGGKKVEVDRSFKNHIGEDDSHSYQTWVNISVLKRFGNLFGGSVESAGGVTDLLLLMAITVIIIGLFFLWQVVIFFIVIIVLALLSGGAALKFVEGTFIETNADRIDSLKLDSFVKEQVGKGYFVDLRSEELYELEPFTTKTLTSTTAFK